MRTLHTFIAVALGAAACAPAQLVELTIDARDTQLGTAHAVIVFDTTDAPTHGNATSVSFGAADASLSVDFADFYAHNPGHAELAELRKASAATLTYSTQEREILLVVEAPHCRLELEIETPVGPFHPYMTTLPSNPTAYLFDGHETQRVRVAFSEDTADAPPLNGEALWRPIDGYVGALAYTVRVLPAPEPERCTEADIAPPFGVLDFDDVLAFIDAFSDACP